MNRTETIYLSINVPTNSDDEIAASCRKNYSRQV